MCLFRTEGICDSLGCEMVGKMRMIKKKEERSDGDIERGNESTLCEKKKRKNLDEN